MNLFLQELRKIWRPGVLAALVALGAVYYYIRPAFYIEYFNNGSQEQADFTLALDWVERYGPTIEQPEREEIGRRLAEEEARFADYAEGNTEMASRGITDFDSFEAFNDISYISDAAYQAAKERGDLALEDHVLYSGETNYFTILELRRFLEAWDGEGLPDPEEGSFGKTRRLDELCRERVRAMREDRMGRSVLPPHVEFSTSTYVRYLAVWCVVSAILLLSPTLVRDRLHRMRPAQWASRRGRRILSVQFMAALVSGLLLTLLNIAIYMVPFVSTGVLAFWRCPLHAVLRSYPWFDWTYGQYLLALAGLVLALSLGASGLTAALSQYSGNYVAMLLKAIPLIVLLTVLGVLVTTFAFYFGNYVTRFLAFPGGEILCAALLLAIGLASCVLACRAQRRREL
ncbi:MAG: hypothetical protein HFG12_07955 [Oscillibacter sp.]|jgi:hypothetical protein|uniref:hypothetical protein n=1 Tax=uncultured Oscillibacter sp. TaxID=876091 RepID=UPI00216CA212|nr:hypothetical protein [uncultured Oscillibacter sp.]MCI8813154.1 hypothetical protein [Oscillibacter sp.]MCX4373082.1 hypothetical protein [Dysosmobacter sp.]